VYENEVNTVVSSGRQPNSAALNRGRHLHSVGRPSRWALAHILVRKGYLFKLMDKENEQKQLSKFTCKMTVNMTCLHVHINLTLVHLSKQKDPSDQVSRPHDHDHDHLQMTTANDNIKQKKITLID